ncbi:MAG: signal peptidase II [Rickettsiales bacterium]|jgi:signal peptidase II|nr:signal peptidase II [Rickettsiales bacterium]
MKRLAWISVGIVAIDQLIKSVLLIMLTGGVPVAGDAFSLIPYPYIIAPVFDFFNIVFTWNPGTAFSLFRALGESAPMILTVITAAIIVLLIWMAKKNPSDRLPLALIIGGAIGNLIDRIRFGAVIDFLDLHIGAWHWPAFNFADICICFGVALYVWGMLKKKK